MVSWDTWGVTLGELPVLSGGRGAARHHPPAVPRQASGSVPGIYSCPGALNLHLGPASSHCSHFPTCPPCLELNKLPRQVPMSLACRLTGALRNSLGSQSGRWGDGDMTADTVIPQPTPCQWVDPGCFQIRLRASRHWALLDLPAQGERRRRRGSGSRGH